MTVVRHQLSLRDLPVNALDSRAQGFSPPLARRRSSCPTPPSPNLELLAHGWEAKWSSIRGNREKTERKLNSPLEVPRITEQPRRHGSSARYIRDLVTQGYRPGGACRSSCGTIPIKWSRSPGPFLVVYHYTIGRTVITLQTPPVTHGPGPARCR